MSAIERQLDEASRGLGDGPSPDVMQALAERAGREGLVDVAYGSADSPFGPLFVAVTERGLVQISYPEHTVEAMVERLARELSPRVLELPARTDIVRRQLDEYFDSGRRDFDLDVDWSLAKGFFRRVLEATTGIAYGDVSTYADVAEQAGSPRAVRAAGNGLGSNRIPIVVPCHRVVRSGGQLGGYTGGVERKQYLLALEQGEGPPA